MNEEIVLRMRRRLGYRADCVANGMVVVAAVRGQLFRARRDEVAKWEVV